MLISPFCTTVPIGWWLTNRSFPRVAHCVGKNLFPSFITRFSRFFPIFFVLFPVPPSSGQVAFFFCLWPTLDCVFRCSYRFVFGYRTVFPFFLLFFYQVSRALESKRATLKCRANLWKPIFLSRFIFLLDLSYRVC